MKLNYAVQRLELRHVFTIARRSSSYRETVRVSLSHDGLRGWGEAAPNPRYSETTAGVAKALDGLASAGLVTTPDSFRHWIYEMRDVVKCASARAALEMALLDWTGQRLRQPLYRLIGADPARMPPTSQTIGIADEAMIETRIEECREHEILKVKLGSSDDRRIITTIRRHTDKVLRVDVNEGWTDRTEALREIEWLADRNVEWVEQPLSADAAEDQAWLHERSPLPLYADESVLGPQEIPRIAAHFDGINIKLAKCGGVLPALHMIDVARDFGLAVMLGCMVESSCGIAAAAHIAPLVDALDLDSNLMISRDPFEGHPVRSGRIILQDRPGTGARLK